MSRGFCGQCGGAHLDNVGCPCHKKLAKSNAERVAKHEQRKRNCGLTQRKRWAHPNDWAKIDAYMAQLAKDRK